MKIAVWVDEQGMTTSLGQPGFVDVYTREQGQWLRCQQIPFALTGETTLSEIRQQTQGMLAQLPDCRHFVARDIHGALLAWLDGTGLTMWKTQGKPEDFLDHIAGQIPPVLEPVTVLHPVLIEPAEEEGTFRLDLLAALQGEGSHTSKRLLMPFFEQHAFRSLEIVCDHVPRWFSSLDAKRFAWRVIPKGDGTLRVFVEPVI